MVKWQIKNTYRTCSESTPTVLREPTRKSLARNIPHRRSFYQFTENNSRWSLPTRHWHPHFPRQQICKDKENPFIQRSSPKWLAAHGTRRRNCTKIIWAIHLRLGGNQFCIVFTETSSMLLACAIWSPYRQPFTFGSECHGMLDDAPVLLAALSSVLYYKDERIHFLHASLPDFLQDQTRSLGYYLDRRYWCMRLSMQCLSTMSSGDCGGT